MTVEFYYWRGNYWNFTETGHVALKMPHRSKIEAEQIPKQHKNSVLHEDGFYISFYTEIKTGKCNCAQGAAHFHTQEMDGIGDQRQTQPERYLIKDLDVDAINQLFLEFVRYPCWGILGSGPLRGHGVLNCAGLTERLLREGGIDTKPCRYHSLYSIFLMAMYQMIPSLINQACQTYVIPPSVFDLKATHANVPEMEKRIREANAKGKSAAEMNHLALRFSSVMQHPIASKIILFVLINLVARRLVHKTLFDTVTPSSVALLADRVSRPSMNCVERFSYLAVSISIIYLWKKYGH